MSKVYLIIKIDHNPWEAEYSIFENLDSMKSFLIENESLDEIDIDNLLDNQIVFRRPGEIRFQLKRIEMYKK